MGEAKVIKAVTEGVTKKVATKEIKERTAKATGKTTKEITREPKVQRNYKDTVSRMLFREPENAVQSMISLCQRLGGTKEQAIEELQGNYGQTEEQAKEKIKTYWKE